MTATRGAWLLLAAVPLVLALACGGCEAAVTLEDGGTGSDVPSGACTGDEQCDDLEFCNGDERCAPGEGGADARGCVAAEGAPCGAGQTCDEERARCTGECVGASADRDGDGEPSIACGGADCDDLDPLRYPTNPEVCDDVDQDCDPTTFGSTDGDRDGYVASRCCNVGDDGARLCGPDCDDGRAAVSPEGAELCNGVDDDCDGAIDGAPASASCVLFGAAETSCERGACTLVSCVAGRDDCDGDATTGCEVELATNAAHCMACGNACSSMGGTPVCRMGACAVDGCMPGTHTCGLSCVRDDVPASCGSRCEPCFDPASGSATCTESGGGHACGVVCDAGFAAVGGDCVAIGTPRILSPLSGQLLTSRRPTLRVELAAGTDGFRAELCTTRDCGVIEATLDFAGASGVLTASGADLGEGRVYFVRVAGRVGAAVGAGRSATFELWTRRQTFVRDTAFGVVPDYDGDGLADLAIATTTAVELALGSPDMGSTDVYRAPSALSSSSGILAVHAVGDVNGDGFGDLLTSSTTACALRLGSASGLGRASTVGRVARCDRAIPLGDVQRDGYADVAVMTATSIEVLHGSATGLVLWAGYPDDATPAAPGTLYPFAAGDYDGDGYGDLVRFRMGTSFASRVLLYRGSASGLVTTPIEIAAPITRTTHQVIGVASAGDVTRDGLSDLLIRLEDTAGGVGRWGRLRLGTTAMGGLAAPADEGFFPDGATTFTGLVDVLSASTEPDAFDDLAISTATDTDIFIGAALGASSTASADIARTSMRPLGPVGATRQGALAGYAMATVDVYVSTRGALVDVPTQTIMLASTVRGIAGAYP